MPKAVDRNPQSRGVGRSIWNPLRPGTSNYNDPFSGVDDTIATVGGPFGKLVNGVLGLFGMGSGTDLFGASFASVWSNVFSVFLLPLKLFAGFGDLKGLINRLLAPWGQDGDFGDDIEAYLRKLTQTIALPLQELQADRQAFEDVLNDLVAQLTMLGRRVGRVELALTDGDDRTGGRDDCSRNTHFQPVGTSPNLDRTGWGALNSDDLVAVLYDASPTTDRHGAGGLFKAKKRGFKRLVICSDAAMSNFAALDIQTTGTGQDVVSIVTGTGPNTGIVPRTTVTMRVPDPSLWQIFYEPVDPDDDMAGDVYYVFLGDSEVRALRWHDAANVVLHGPGFRHVGVVSDRGPAISEFVFDDWTEPAPA